MPTAACFHLFRSLPYELRRTIWDLALATPRRVVQLDVTNHCYVRQKKRPDDGNDYVVFAGKLRAWNPPGFDEHLVWPPSSQYAVETLASTCYASRLAVIEQYPDMVRVYEPGQESRRGTSMPTFRRSRMVRVNFASDLFFFRMSCAVLHVGSAETLAWRSHSALDDFDISPVLAEEFLRTLCRIQHVLLEAQLGLHLSDPLTDSLIGPISFQYMYVLPSMKGLCSIALCSEGTAPAYTLGFSAGELRSPSPWFYYRADAEQSELMDKRARTTGFWVHLNHFRESLGNLFAEMKKNDESPDIEHLLDHYSVVLSNRLAGVAYNPKLHRW